MVVSVCPVGRDYRTGVADLKIGNRGRKRRVQSCDPGWQLEQQTEERTICESEQQHARQSEQQCWLSPPEYRGPAVSGFVKADRTDLPLSRPGIPHPVLVQDQTQPAGPGLVGRIFRLEGAGSVFFL